MLLNAGAALYIGEKADYVLLDSGSGGTGTTFDWNLAIGFGISTPEQAARMAGLSDGAIVGSAIIKILEKYGRDAPAHIGEYVKSMKEAVICDTPHAG